MQQAAFWGQSSKQSLRWMWLGRVRELTVAQLGDRWEAGSSKAKLCVVMVLEGPVWQAIFQGQSSEADLKLMWVCQQLEPSICVALWVPISWVPMVASVWD